MADDHVATKRCCRCGEAKSFDCFHSDKSKRDGKTSRCIDCNKAAAKQWHTENQSRHKQTAAEYYRRNREDILLRQSIYRKENVERLRAMSKRWRQKNRDRKRENDLRWHGQNRDRVLIYRRTSESRRRATKDASQVHYTSKDVERLRILQKGRCASCRIRLGEDFHVDHRTPLAKGGDNGPLNIQLLCKSCNCRKSAKDPVEFMQEQGFLL
jgi:hypothetical protein